MRVNGKMVSEKLKPNGDLVKIGGHRIHVFGCGNKDAVKLVFMAGSGTAAPVYDFKCLYEKLVPDFRIIMIEKPGYGYSDIFSYPCDIDSLVVLQRDLLDQLDERGPYVLVPHSMAGLEAIRWKQKYPDEVEAIIGIDMGTPLTYGSWTGKDVSRRIRMMNTFRKLGIYRLLNIPPLAEDSLTEGEVRQQKLLQKRNTFNSCYCNEAAQVLKNAEIVQKGGNIDCPVLLFVSNGTQNSGNWLENQRQFAIDTKAKLIQYDCGHYIHHFKSDEMAEEIKIFILNDI